MWHSQNSSWYGKINSICFVFCCIRPCLYIYCFIVEWNNANVFPPFGLKWYEAFSSWLTEAKWSKSGYIPSTEEYLRTGMISIAAHTVALQGSCFLNPSLPIYKLTPTQYEPVTKLLMVITRLLNDIQSYQVCCQYPFHEYFCWQPCISS